MKILLLGGTGAMGNHLARILFNRGDRVYITTRREVASNDCAPTSPASLTSPLDSPLTSSQNSRQGGICYIQGNARDLDFTLKILDSQHFDYVVDFMVYGTIEFADRIHLLLSKCAHYVFLSSARVYANSEAPLREDSPRLLDTSTDKAYLATDEYALAKARQENILSSLQKPNFTIIRPYITFSEIRLQLGVYEKESWLYRALQGKPIVFFREIATHYTTMTYALEVARAIGCILGQSSTYGETYTIASKQHLRWEEILSIYQKVLSLKIGHEVKVIFANLSEFFDSKMYQVIYDRLFDRKFDSSKIDALLKQNGQNPISSEDFQAHITQCIASFIQNPVFNYVDYADEAHKDAICGYSPTKACKHIPRTQDKITYLKSYKHHAKTA